MKIKYEEPKLISLARGASAQGETRDCGSTGPVYVCDPGAEDDPDCISGPANVAGDCLSGDGAIDGCSTGTLASSTVDPCAAGTAPVQEP